MSEVHVTLLYIDPGIGFFTLQLGVAALFGGLIYFRNLWRRVLGKLMLVVRPGGGAAVRADQEQDGA